MRFLVGALATTCSVAAGFASAACGVGDEVLLARYHEQRPDGSAGDPGSLDGGPGSDAGNDPAGNPDGGDAAIDTSQCFVPPEREPVACTHFPPPGTSLPRVKWKFPPASLDLKQDSPPGTPLVANLTDDNGDGMINLCDDPDVLVVAGKGQRGAALWMLAGESGDIERLIDQPLMPGSSPAIADLEGDGVPEIIVIDIDKHLMALEPDGSMLWLGAEVAMPAGVQPACYAVSVYDVDGDGSPEILAGFDAFDAQGNRRFGVSTDLFPILNPAQLDGCIAPVAADLTGDGQLEMLFGHATLGPDGKQLWRHRFGEIPSIPVVANLDPDPQPEVVLTAANTVYVLRADGSERASLTRSCGGNVPSVHDFNGDGVDELALPDCDGTRRATVYQLQDSMLVPRWSAENLLGSVGTSSVSSFDFEGKGAADLVYADDQASARFAGVDGRMIFEGLRVGAAVNGTPVIADIDNDGEADLLLPAFEARDPSVLTVISGEPGTWMSARRIWNQHAYHVTNVHEDARIPKAVAEAPKLPLRMRSNAHREGNRICIP